MRLSTTLLSRPRRFAAVVSSVSLLLTVLVGSGRASAGTVTLDLSNTWTPYIFSELADASGQPAAARYRGIYLGLASDTGDADGQPLPPGEHNYLELYGIPPTLGVLRARFLEDAAPTRCADVNFELLRSIPYLPIKDSTKLPKDAAHRPVFTEVERRLRCEGLLTPKMRHSPGRFDDAFRTALVRFQHKNMLYDGAGLRTTTMQALARHPLDNDHAALLRVLTERVVSAANILEDGSVDGRSGPPTYTNAAGQKTAVRNLVDEALAAVVEQLHLGTPSDALAFFQQHDAASFETLRVPVTLPPPPEYYAPHMDLAIEVDRGDVNYDPPYDAEGKPNPLRRKHFPMLTLSVRYGGKLIPLIRWRTTIGGWRADLASDGYEYFRYKGSDVGPRVWRNVVAGPVWIAPNSTPIRTLVKRKMVRKLAQTVVNYDEVGPGYLSAYGLVAAYNVVPGQNGRPDWDNGVRVHGSSEILSIRNPEAYSHGCHRLMNHLAVRLFSFVLRHRTVVIEGEKPLNFSRQFLWKEDVFEMRLPTRGFWFRLDPPLPVMVTEGNIISEQKKPILTYVPKPGVIYPPGPPPLPPDVPEDRAGGDGE